MNYLSVNYCILYVPGGYIDDASRPLTSPSGIDDNNYPNYPDIGEKR